MTSEYTDPEGEDESYLRDWLRSAPRTPLDPLPLAPDLTAYLAGVLPTESARWIMRAAARDAEARTRLISLNMTLDRLRQKRWDELAVIAAGDNPDAEAAALWVTLLQDQLKSASPTERADLGSTWSAFRRFLASMVDAARIPRMALVRGSGDSPVLWAEGSLPSGVEFALLEAGVERLTEGGISIRAEAAVMEGGSTTRRLDGSAVVLSLRLAGERWPVAEAVVESGKLKWTACFPGLEPLLRDGPLAGEQLSVRIAGSSPIAATAFVLPARVQRSSGSAVKYVSLALPSTPYWMQETLHLELDIPDTVAAEYPNAELRLFLAVSPTVEQYLGAWLLVNLSNRPSRVSVRCPGSPDLQSSGASLLRASIVLPEGE